MYRDLIVESASKTSSLKQSFFFTDHSTITAPSNKFLFSAFEEQCFLCPTATALIFDEKEITYVALHTLISKLVSHLTTLRVQKNTLVAIMLPKSDYQVIAALAILKAGAAYMPINMHESFERKQALLMQGQVNIVLTLSDINVQHPWLENYATISLDTFLENTTSLFEDVKENNVVNTKISSTDLAYVLFTSGSTGTPKGVMINHSNAVNTIDDINERFHVSATDKMLALSAFDFDLSVYDIFGLLAVGGTVVIPTEEQLVEPEAWLELIEKHKITLWDTVPGFMEMLVRCIKLKNLESEKIISSLRLILLSGDWIRVQLPCEIQEYCPQAQIVSLGGATEASIWSIAYPIEVNSIDETWKSIPYGRALKNQAFYVLNETQILLDAGEEGELYIGGQGVGLGYWQDTINTNYHFVHHPTLGYLYRTGDKGRMLPDGNIEFLGRVGEQVKLRGFRIDLKAIETCVESIPTIARCVAKIININENTNNLVAFIKSQNLIDAVLKNKELRQQLADAHLSYWQTIYNSIFDNSELPQNPHFNTTGWVSSYTRQCIPEYQMREWRDHTVSRILSLKPKRVLEVGPGTGLLLGEIAPRVSIYDAADTSHQIVAYIDHHFKSTESYQHVQCVQGNFESFRENLQYYDTVVLNSVAQYFPDVIYLTDVLNRLIDKIAAGGQFFLGDIYHYDYLEDFHLSVQLQHQPAETTLSQFYTQLSQVMARESELFIHPQLFIDFAKQHPRITCVDIQLKAGQTHNELNGFRYDVVLSIEQAHKPVSQVKLLPAEAFSSITTLREYLEHHSSEAFVVEHLPNLRLIGLSQHHAFKSEKQGTISVLREAVYHYHNERAIDPYECYQLGQALGYQVSCRWSTDKYYFDVAFYKQNNPLAYASLEKANKEYCFYNYTNIPLVRQFQRTVDKNIQDKISKSLAPYMQPHEILFIDEIPLTANGKVNHKALVELASSHLQDDALKYGEPASPLEEQLVDIFKRILKLNYIHPLKSFAQLGGDSLMLLELAHEIDKCLGQKLTMKDLITHSSVKELSGFLEGIAQKESASLISCGLY